MMSEFTQKQGHGFSSQALSLLPHLLNSAAAAVAMKDLDGSYLLVNQELTQLFGCSSDQILGRKDSDILPPETATILMTADREVIKSGKQTSSEIEYQLHGVTSPLLTIHFPIKNSHGGVESVGILTLDISSQRQSTKEIRQALKQSESINRQLRQALVKMELIATTDKLTHAWNRHRLEEVLTNEMQRLDRFGHPVTILLIDIDHFKRVNDDYGHLTGDQALAEFAQVIREAYRGTDSLARWGGEEFIVLLPNTLLVAATLVAERIRAAVASFPFSEIGKLTASIGVAECLTAEDQQQWLQRADAALYQAKQQGRNQVVVSPESQYGVIEGSEQERGFLQLVWRSAYESGNTTIDQQHQQLFQHTNQLLTVVLDGRPDSEVAEAATALIVEIEQHFADEEQIIRAVGFPHAKSHTKIHAALVDRAHALLSHFQDRVIGIGELFQFLAYEMITQHMLGADRQFFPYLRVSPPNETNRATRPQPSP